MAIFKGRTEEAEAPILGAGWWQKGSKIIGRVVRSFQTEVSKGQSAECYQIALAAPVRFSGKNTDRVSVGALKGFHMALSAAGLSELKPGDKLLLECTGQTETEKGNPMVNFYVEVERGDS